MVPWDLGTGSCLMKDLGEVVRKLLECSRTFPVLELFPSHIDEDYF